MLAASWNFLKFQNKNEEKKNEQNKETKPNESIAKVDDDVSDEYYFHLI